MAKHQNTRKKLIQLAIPISSSGILNKIGSMIAIIFLGFIGKDQIAASSLAINSYITLLTVSATLFYSVSILCGHSLGEDNRGQVRSIFQNGMLIAIVLSIPISTILWNVDVLLQWCHQEPHLIAIATPYFHWIALSLPPTLLNMVIIQFFIGISRPKVVLYKTVLSLPIMLALSFVFILGKFGFPQMGLGGMALAILIVQIVSCILLFAYVYFDSSLKPYRLFYFRSMFNFHISKKILVIGAPIGLQIGGELSAITAVTYLLGHYGVNALAAGQIVSQYVTLVIMLTMGLSQALSVLISQSFGEKDFKTVKSYKRASFNVVTSAFVVIALIFVLFPKVLMMPYVDVFAQGNADIVKLGTVFFYIAALLLYVDSIRNMLSACLRGLHLSALPMIVGVVCLWCISVPMAYFCGIIMGGSPIALRLGFVSGFFVATIILMVYFKKHLVRLSNDSVESNVIR